MPITPKSAEQIIEEFEQLEIENCGKWKVDRNVAKKFLNSSLASFLVYASRKSYPTAEYFMLDPRILKDTTAAIRIKAMQEFHHNLLSLAESINKKV